ncbi:MAG: dihydrodipicolinate synthase family protein [Candidatus Limivicinus sp.]|jgi:4-hydroxy-tetrahydrodipicolinate synthase
MRYSLPDGVWPVMLTPFSDDGKIDYGALEELIDWYAGKGCDGLFAVCQSSEMFFLSQDERVELAAFVKKHAGKLPVIASGHVSDSMEAQKQEMQRMADTGVDAIVLLSNRFDNGTGDDELFIKNLDELTASLPESVPLGFYECPYPFKRVLTPAILRHCLDVGRYHFIKDTCSDINCIRAKLDILRGTGMKLFNANTASLSKSLEAGASGYCGVMANFHPELYKWLVENRVSQPEKADILQNVLTLSALIELKSYPMNAKVYLNRYEGLHLGRSCRKNGCTGDIGPAESLELEQFKHISEELVKMLRA